ncbi:MAG TPA: sialidase family protein [Candidatus Dormibacteraeota bacterium]|nr:sialidase family protein [Candidatus Dormibacteraeota bacterium]
MKCDAVTVAFVLLVLVAFAPPVEAAKNLAPVACFTPSPGYGVEGTTYALDASCTTDDKTPLDRLRFRWDFQNDGVWDTSFSTGRIINVQYGAFGTKNIRLEVIDQSNLGGQTTRNILEFRTTAIPNSFGETNIDVSPLDPQKLALSVHDVPWQPGPDSVPYPAFHSSDGGAQWSPGVGPGPIYMGDTNIRFDSAGNVLVSNLIDGDVGAVRGGLIVARSTDGGATFATPTYAFNSDTLVRFKDGSLKTACANSTLRFDYPKLGADRSSTSQYRDNQYVVTRMSVDTNGDGSCDGGWFWAFRRFPAGGTDWDQAFIAGDDNADPAGDFQNIAVAQDGTVYLAGGSYGPLCPSGIGIGLLKSTDGGGSFPNPLCVFNRTPTTIPDEMWSATDPANPSRVWIAFVALQLQPVIHRDIYVIRSSDAGATWSAPVRVDDVLPDDIVDRWKPTLSVGGNGRLDIAWFDYRNSSPKTYGGSWTQPLDVYYSWSVDGGISWAPNVRLTPLAPGFGVGNDYLGIASSGTRAYVAYAQQQVPGSSWQVYVATIGH